MKPEVFEKRMGEAIMLLLSVAMLSSGLYYIYFAIQRISY
jgi:hypothetical protein